LKNQPSFANNFKIQGDLDPPAPPLPTPMCRQRIGHEQIAISSLQDTRTANLAQVQCHCHIGKHTVTTT